MRLPSKNILPWAMDIIDECNASKSRRITEAGIWRNYYYKGTQNGDTALFNRCGSHIKRLSSYLFSSADVRFRIDFDYTQDKDFKEQANFADKLLSREFHRCGINMVFSEAVKIANIKGCCFIKTIWGHDGFDSYIIHPEAVGVYREDIDSLERQEAFVHTFYLTIGQFRRLVEDHPEKDELIRKVKHSMEPKKGDDGVESDNYISQVILSGIGNAFTGPGTQNSNRGVDLFSSVPAPQMTTEMAKSLIRVDELWVRDDDLEDWTTIQVANRSVVVEGKLRHRNLCGVKGETGFTKVSTETVSNYFWGQSELAHIQALQDMLNRRMDEYSRVAALRANAPKAYIGFSGMTQEKHRALNSPGGFLSEDTPNGKIEKLAPDMPEEAFAEVNQIIDFMDEITGFKPILQGHGESGVRSGDHAETMMKTASTNLRDRALLVERQCSELGDFCFKLMQNKDARQYTTRHGHGFLLSGLPNDFRVSVDSHSSSVAFTEEIRSLAFALNKIGAIEDKHVLMLTHPPLVDILEESLDAKAEEQARLVRENPSLLEKMFSGKKKK